MFKGGEKMKSEIEKLILDLKREIKDEIAFRTLSVPKPNPYDSIRSRDRQNVKEDIVKKLSEITG